MLTSCFNLNYVTERHEHYTTCWRHWCVCSLVITVRHRLYRSFQSRPTSQNIMISVKYTLACRFSFFQLFLKKMQKSSPKQGSPWCWYQWLIKFKAVYFPGRQKIKCQTTGRPRTCHPCHFPVAKSDYNPGRRREEGQVYFVRTKMKSASRNESTILEFYHLRTAVNRAGWSSQVAELQNVWIYDPGVGGSLSGRL